MSLPTVGIAGATGFVGRALINALHAKYNIVALTRGTTAPDPRVTWRSCNLFNLLHTEKALAGVHTAFYLVHSMSPSARLAQGNFADMDLICADNYARAARAAGVQHIIYLGGLIPADDELSMHLRSRLEVETTLRSHGVPVTTLRAGLVIGPGGSSFQMMVRLVRRLPLMLTPIWTKSLTQPVALRDVVALLTYALDHPEDHDTYDVGCPDVLSYSAMLKQTAELMGRTLSIITVPFTQVNLSLWWISLITQTPWQLVLPLVQSLRHDMVARDGLRLQARAGVAPQTFHDAMRDALAQAPARPRGAKSAPVKKAGNRGPGRNTVLSVQRLPLPKGRNAEWVADEYARWLPQAMHPVLRVSVQEGRVYRFFLPFFKTPLLELSFAPLRSSPNRQLFYITGGLLTRLPQPEPGRFEFRSALDNSVCLAAVHDFVPRLPWFVYKITQAIVHGWVMSAFGRHLSRATSVGEIAPIHAQQSQKEGDA